MRVESGNKCTGDVMTRRPNKSDTASKISKDELNETSESTEEKNERKRVVAAVDLGTNSVHLLVAQASSEHLLKPLDKFKAVVRLGQHMDSQRMITEKGSEHVILALKKIREIADPHEPFYRVIATQATRMAENQKEFLSAIYSETGLDVEVIDGREEARLISLGIQIGLSLNKVPFFAVDVGGGSTEFSFSNESEISYATSVPLGAVKLMGFFEKCHRLEQVVSFAACLENMERQVRMNLEPLVAEVGSFFYDQAILTSGAAKCLAVIDAYNRGVDLEEEHGYILEKEAVISIYREMVTLATPKAIRKRWPISKERSEIILSGACILESVTRIFDVKQWVVSTYGLREGLVIDTIARLPALDLSSSGKIRGVKSFGKPAAESQHESSNNVQWSSIEALGDICHTDPEHRNTVCQLALNIYDQFVAARHISLTICFRGVCCSDRDLLIFAARLHEAGKFIHNTSYHKHGQYIVNNSPLMGFTQRERAIIALLIRYQRKGIASGNKKSCRFLNDNEIQRINILAGILRISVALCRTRRKVERNIALNFEESKMQITVDSKVFALAELFMLEKQKDMLEKMFCLSISINRSYLSNSSNNPD